MAHTADEVPQVQSQWALERLVGAAKGIVQEEASGDAGEENEHATEEDHTDVKIGWDGLQQVWKDYRKQ